MRLNIEDNFTSASRVLLFVVCNHIRRPSTSFEEIGKNFMNRVMQVNKWMIRAQVGVAAFFCRSRIADPTHSEPINPLYNAYTQSRIITFVVN